MVADNGIVATAAPPSPRRRGGRLAFAAVTAAALGMIGGCGIKGPLYLPQTPPAATAPAAPPAPPDPAQTGNANDISRRNESISHTPLTQ